MTGFAFDPEMPAEQRVLRMKFMVKDDAFPIPFRVASSTFLSVAPLMHIVFLVAGVTVHRSVFESRCEMAFLTFDGCVFSDQRKPGLVMIERGFLPGTFVMTFFTLRAFLPLMLIVFLVTAVTIYGRVLVSILRVTFFARHFPVFPPERIFGLVVVKPDFFPGVLGMTIRA